MSLAPHAVGATGALTAYGPANRPLVDYLTALGLSRRGRTRGITLVGALEWAGGGTAVEDLTTGVPCRDSVAEGAGLVVLTGSPSRLRSYLWMSAGRTRCQGPTLPSNGLTGGGLDLPSLGRPGFTLRVRPTAPGSDDGYTMTTSGALALTVARGRLSDTFARVPSGLL